jgi:hypothetical protein
MIGIEFFETPRGGHQPRPGRRVARLSTPEEETTTWQAIMNLVFRR